MTRDDTESRPLDLSDLRDAETLGRAWDTWLTDDLEPTRHAISQTLADGVAATVEDIYDRDYSPGPSPAFRRGLRRELLNVHDALRLGAASGAETAWASNAVTSAPATISPPLPPIEIRPRGKRKRPSRPDRGGWPAVEFAAAMIVFAALFGVTFGNARIAEFFRDHNAGNVASNGDGSSTQGSLVESWSNEVRDDLDLGLRPDRIVAADGYVAVVSSQNQAQAISLSLFNASDGVRIWTARDVSEGIYEGAQGRDSAPVIADGRLFFMNRAGFLYIFDIEAYPGADGLLFSQPLPFSATESELIVLDGIVYAVGFDARSGGDIGPYLPDLAEADGSLFMTGGTSDILVGVDVESGIMTTHQAATWPIDSSLGTNPLWRFDPESGLIADWAQDWNLLATHVASLGDGRLAVTYRSPDGASNVVSIRDTDNIHEELSAFKSDQTLHGEGIVVGDTIVLTVSDPESSLAIYAFDGHDAARPRLAWDYVNPQGKPDPVIGGESAIVVSDADMVRIYDPESGETIGQTQIDSDIGEVTAIDVEDSMVFLSFEDGSVAGFTLVASDPSPLPARGPTPAST